MSSLGLGLAGWQARSHPPAHNQKLTRTVFLLGRAGWPQAEQGLLSPPLNCESRREDPRMSQSHLCPQPSGAVAWGIAVEKKSSFRVKAAWEVLYSTLPGSSTLGMTLGKLPNLPESLIYKMVKQFLLNSVGNCIWN